LAGARAEVGRPSDGLLQPVSLVFQLANIDFAKLEIADWDRLIPLFEAECPEVVVARKKLAFLVTGGVLAFFIMNHVKHVNTVDPADHTRAEIVGRRQARQVWQFLRRYVPGCEECVIAAMGTEVGVRETRRIVGDYAMTRQDILGAHKFPDAIGCSTAWIDAHHPEGISIRHEFLPRDEWFEVPYRALVTAGLTNVYTVGRCMSSTHEAQSALRVIPTLMMVGEAAGTAAALCARQGVAARELDVGLLQRALAAAGAYLGTAQPAEAAPPTVV
jgi:hypothetical protein